MEYFLLRETDEKNTQKHDNKQNEIEKSETTSTYKMSKVILNWIRKLYKQSDEELLGDGVDIIAAFIKYLLFFAVAASSQYGVVLAGFTWFMNRIISKNMTYKQRAQLLTKLETSLELVEGRIRKATSENKSKEKESLIKIRNSIKSKIFKLKSFKVKSELNDDNSNRSRDYDDD